MWNEIIKLCLSRIYSILQCFDLLLLDKANSVAHTMFNSRIKQLDVPYETETWGDALLYILCVDMCFYLKQILLLNVNYNHDWLSLFFP